MKKFIALLALVFVSASTMMYAQESNAAARRADRKAQRDAERAKLRAEEQVQDMAAYQQAVQALKNKQFVLEANQVIFRNGMSAFVTSNTNFVLMNGNRATVQTAFNTPYPGPNGIGGITVDGNSSDMKMNVDKPGNHIAVFGIQNSIFGGRQGYSAAFCIKSFFDKSSSFVKDKSANDFQYNTSFLK